jgi:superfamily II DNA/RNA helicase
MPQLAFSSFAPQKQLFKSLSQSILAAPSLKQFSNTMKLSSTLAIAGSKSSRAVLKSSKRNFSAQPDLPKDPELSIANFGLHPEIVDTLTTAFKITHLFPIQAQVMKPIQQRKDVFGKSRTGTGKTLAFLLPMIDEIAKQNYARPTPNTAQIIIMEPTRELALQVSRELEKLNPRIRVTTVYGGAPYEQQRNALRNGVHICVATPGRLIDLCDSGSVSLASTQRIVLDEADEMLKLGFQQSIEQILQGCSPDRQTVLFSATLPNSIQNIVRRYTKDIEFIDCAAGSDATPSLIKHKACMLPRATEDIPRFVLSLFRMYSANGRAIVFSDTKAMASDLETLLNAEAKSQNFAAALHGDVSQNQREAILQKFRDGRLSVLLATDVAARGIDIPAVDLVVQLGIPREVESYVHRSGRTGRAGKQGTAVLCYRNNERDQMGSLSSQTGVRFSQVVREDLKTVDIDQATIDKVTKMIGSGLQLITKRHEEVSKELDAGVYDLATHPVDDDTAQGKDPVYASAIRITRSLLAKHTPEVVVSNMVLKQLNSAATSGVEGTPFSLLSSTPFHTTIAFPPNETVASITRMLARDADIQTNLVRMINTTYTNQAVLADIPDDLMNSLQPLIDDKTIDYVQIPRKLPSELFVGGIVGQTTRGGGRGGSGGRGGNFTGGNRQGGGFGGQGGGYQGNRQGGGYQGGNDRQGGGYQGNRQAGGYQGNRQGGGYKGNRY